MLEFSQLLSKYIHEKNVKTSALAQYCGLDRSNLYKVINGKRNPSSMEMVREMCRFLNLTYREQQEMEDAYEICVVGPEDYYRRKEVYRFFKDFQLPQFKLPLSEYGDRGKKFEFSEEATLLQTATEVDRFIFYILTEEMKNRNGHLYLLMQPDHEFFMNLLSTADYAGSQVSMEQIICLESNMKQTYSNYNIHCLEKLLPLYCNTYEYNCYYYYENAGGGKKGTFSLFSYMIITSEYACLLTDDFQKGYCISDKKAIKMLINIFKEYRSAASPLLRPFTDASMQMQYVLDITRAASEGYAFQMTPCITPYFTRDLLEKYIAPDTPHRKELILMMDDYVKNTYRTEASNIQINSIYSMDGVRKFMETGRLGEYPQELYQNIEMADRIVLLKRLHQNCKRKTIRFLKNNIVNLDNELFLFVTETRGYIIIENAPEQKLIYLDIEEPGLIFAFRDFCETLNEELFYSKDETEKVIALLIEEYSHQNKSCNYISGESD